MTSPLEHEIHRLLGELKEPELVAQNLVERWRQKILSREEQYSVALFLLHSGQYAALFDEVDRALKENEWIPWGPYLEAILSLGHIPNAHQITALLQGINAQEAMGDAIRCGRIDSWREEFSRARHARYQEKKAEWQLRHSQLFDELEFARSQGMFEEERRKLEEIFTIYPNDPRALKEQKKFEERWAREIISSRASDLESKAELRVRFDRLPEDQRASKDVMREQALKTANEKQHLAIDLALQFYFLDLPKEALEILAFAKDSPQKDWLRLELQIEARLFLEALEETHRMESVYAENPDYTFSLWYTRAIALWGLGQKALAIELIKSIIKYRPTYKSAATLLSEWEMTR